MERKMRLISKIALWSSELSIVVSFLAFVGQLWFQYSMPIIALPWSHVFIILFAFGFSFLVRASLQSFFSQKDIYMQKRILFKQLLFITVFGVLFWIVNALYGTWFGFIFTSLTVFLWCLSTINLPFCIGSRLSDLESSSFLGTGFLAYVIEQVSNKISE